MIISLNSINRTIFTRVRRIVKTDYLFSHVCVSVRKQQLGSYWTDFHEI